MIISLLYHDVVAPGDFASSGFQGKDADIYKLDRPQFEQHLEALNKLSTRPEVKLLDSAASQISSSALVFTFDDGGASALCAAALLEARGWRGHFFIATDYIGKPGFLSTEEIREMHARGHVVGSHSCSHPVRMSHCQPAQIEHEWKESTRILSSILGTRVRVASVPGGYYSRKVGEAAAAAGIEVLFNSEPTTRVIKLGECVIAGRYSIQQATSAATVGRIVSGKWPARWQQYLFWNSKKLAKKLGGSYYLALRKLIFRTAE